MSIIIPISIGILFYNDLLDIYKAIGIIAALISFYLILQKPKTDKKKKILIVRYKSLTIILLKDWVTPSKE